MFGISPNHHVCLVCSAKQLEPVLVVHIVNPLDNFEGLDQVCSGSTGSQAHDVNFHQFLFVGLTIRSAQPSTDVHNSTSM